MCFFISGGCPFLKVGMGLIWTFLISNILIFIIGILNFWGIDVLEMKVGLIKSQYAVFQSTIGNINFFELFMFGSSRWIGLVLFIGKQIF